ncbi:MAG TPA: hypothetical protein VEW69_06545, partial [Alphaproteobacteria bacterium]|nr:hypothetical protein [Alphaproteobacteria bacterium]
AVYEELGGHQAVATELLEDVALAKLFKRAGCNIHFGYGRGLVRARMYRSFASMWEGWTKNLALLFPHPLRFAVGQGLSFVLIIALFIYGVLTWGRPHPYFPLQSPLVCGAFLYISFLAGVRHANFSWKANLLAIFGMPMFALLLVRSYLHTRRGAVTWKGRTLTPSAPPGTPGASMKDAKLGSRS